MSKLALKGIYQNGHVTLEGHVVTGQAVPVAINFLADNLAESAEPLLQTLSFKKAQELSASIRASLADALIEERRKYPLTIILNAFMSAGDKPNELFRFGWK